jgi:hypothetical protein
MFTKKFRLLSVPLLVLLVLAAMVGTVAAATINRTTVHAFGEDPREPGPGSQGTLRREADGVTYNIHTSNLDPGAAYTNWGVVFNAPDLCSGDCDLGDVQVTPEDNEALFDSISIFWTAGAVIPESSPGAANFSAFIPQGEPLGQLLRGTGLQDVEEAEVHIIIRTHGQPIEGLLEEQLTTVAGGCDINQCDDQQAIAFLP